MQAVRLAAPLQGASTRSLADADNDLQAVIALTSGPAEPLAYVERPFLYPASSRFSDGSFGVFYCANSLGAAVREVAYHLSRIFAATRAPVLDTRRVRLACTVRATLEDIRRSVEPQVDARIYDEQSYEWSQPFGAALRTDAAPGVRYDSVRCSGAECVAAFTPHVIKRITIDSEMSLKWDGTRFSESALIEPL